MPVSSRMRPTASFTTAGRPAELDLDLLEKEGLVIRPPPHKPHPPSLRPAVRVEGIDANGVA